MPEDEKIIKGSSESSESKEPKTAKTINKENLNKEAYYSVNNAQVGGVVKIATDVVALIAEIAVLEADGVAALAGKNQLLNKKAPAKGIQVKVNGDSVSIEISMVIRYGYSVKETAKNVQERVKASIEDMTGLCADDINIHIIGIEMPNKKVSVKDD